jgi:hypothetical protein
MKPHALQILASAALLAACSSPSSPPPPSPLPADPAPPEPTPPPTPPPPTSTSFEGRWASDKCDKRTYARWIDLTPDGHVAGRDRVSPCPEKAVCVWSGIVSWEGQWKAAGDRITLTVSSSGGGPAIELPKELVWDTTANAPAEIHGEVRCPYRARSEPL